MTNGVHTARYETTNEELVRRAYAVAEVEDIPGRVDCFTPDGAFIDNSVAVTYRGPTTFFI